MNSFSDTCAALSTAHGKAGVAVIRISGNEAIDICEKVFFPMSCKKLAEFSSREAIYGEIICEGKRIDTAICTIFKAPNSYTGENTVEISCHGSEVAVSMILSALFENGARPAEAGEFTKKAFINGKLDLTQAEAVAELIEAQSSASLVLSNAKVKGKLSKKISELGEKLNNVLSSVYAFIDYPDEDLTDMTNDEMETEIIKVLDEIKKLISTFDIGRAISDGVNATIIGSPNVGKSSFLNFLTNSERAIVTDIAGTTRDIVTESVTIENIRLNLSDTAGIRETQDTVEKIGVSRSLSAMENSEIIFAIFDISKELTNDDLLLISKLEKFEKTKNIIYILNKSDLSDESLDKFINKKYFVEFSSKSGSGYERFKEILSLIYPVGTKNLEEGLILSSARQLASLKNAALFLENSLYTLKNFTQDLAGQDLEKSLEYLYETDGRMVSTEIVNNIFSHFCVGK